VFFLSTGGKVVVDGGVKTGVGGRWSEVSGRGGGT